MCGIFGGIGNRINPGTIRALALINRERGTHSLGFFSNTGRAHKESGDPLTILAYDELGDYIENTCRKGWFIAGHTRHATHGKRNKRNAHPFRFGRFIGSHNGIVDYPEGRNYKVDSEYLIDELHRADGDYQTALGKVSGYWGLSWFDGCEFYLQAHENRIELAQSIDGAWYYSSDDQHLYACIGKPIAGMSLEDGDTVRFDIKGLSPVQMPSLVNTARRKAKDWRTSGASSNPMDGSMVRYYADNEDYYDADFSHEDNGDAPDIRGPFWAEEFSEEFADCFDENGSWMCGECTEVLYGHDDAYLDENGNLICHYCAKHYMAGYVDESDDTDILETL